MNVLLISRCLPYPLHHGDRLTIYHAVRKLHERGHQFDLLAFHLAESDLQEIPHVAELFRDIEPIRERPRTSREYLIRLGHPFPDRAAQCWNPSMWEAIQRHLAQKPYDLVHLFGGIQVYEYRNLVRELPNVIVPYDSYALYMKRALLRADGLRHSLRLQAISAITHQYERTIYRGFDRTVLISEQDQEYLHRLAPQVVTTVIPNGVDTDYFKPRDPSLRSASLVFVGNYDYQPNVEAAMALIREVFPAIRQAIPEARVVIVGPNPPLALASLEGNGVEVTGYVPDVRPYLAQAACFIAPLTLGSGMKDKILEAMSMNVPVVATPLGCEGIAVTSGEDVLLGQNPEELAGAAIRLFRDRALRNRVANAGRELMLRRYNWRTTADQYETLYNQVIAERQSWQSK